MDESEMDTSGEELVNRLRTLLIAQSLLSPNNNEEQLLNKLRGLVTNIKWSPADVEELFVALLQRFESTTKDRSHLLPWLLEILHCIEINYITPSWTCGSEKTLIDLVRDKTVTDEKLKGCLAADTEKELKEILDEIRQQKLNQVDEQLLENVRDIVSSVVVDLRSHNDGSQRTGLKKDLLRLCQAVEKTHFTPRLTQMVSWCIMALSETGQLIQVGTGEGKSCIVAMFAAYRAMTGESVDIMSSSSVLAERDLKDWNNFYKVLKITASCNTNKQDKDQLKKCYRCQVVYGTVEEFAGDWLRHHFKREDIFERRTFQCAIVDEVDSLMLDKGLHVVYLSSEMPVLQHLNPLLAFIWATANQYSKSTVRSDVSSVLSTIKAEIEKILHVTPCELNQDKCKCYVPGFLADLVKSKLKVWIENAFYAQTMTEDHQYTIEKHGIVPVDYSCTGVVENNMKWSDGLQQFLEMKHQLKLSDMTAITNYMSNVGLLQKYGNQIFGISGTLGQQAETETLQKIYKGITVCQIPTFKHRKLFEVEGVIVNDEIKWIEKICHVVTNHTQRAVLVICETINRAKVLHDALGDKVQNKRLYISNNMDNTEIFAKKLDAGDIIIATNLAGRGTDLRVSDQVKKTGGLFVVQTFLPKNARVEAQAFGRTARQGSPGSAQLIVCTNHLQQQLQLLVRAKKVLSLLEDITDVTPLHQALFLMQFRLYQKSPSNVQTEEMSSTLSDILTKNSNSEIKMVKKIRDDLVAERLASYVECDIPKIKEKEELFSQYLGELDDVYKTSNNKPAESYLSALNEFWGIWLLANEKESITDLKTKLTVDLKTAREKLEQRESPSSNLHHYTAFGNELRQEGRLPESIKMYTKAIQEDNCWAAIAYYNRAFASLTRQDRRQQPDCIDQALEDLQNALKSVELYCDQIEVTCRYSKQQSEDLPSDAISRFDSHMKTRYEVLLFFKANINEAIQKVDRARELGGYVKVEKSLVHFMVPPVRFLDFLVLSTQAVTLVRSRDPLKIHQFNSHSFCDILHELRSLETLGLTHVYTLDTMFSLGSFFSKIHRFINGACD